MIKQVTELPMEFINRLETDLQQIKRSLQNMKALPQDEFLTPDEFMSRIKVSRWKFDMLVKQGMLQYKKIGRKFYIPINEVSRYFAGELNLDK